MSPGWELVQLSVSARAFKIFGISDRKFHLSLDFGKWEALDLDHYSGYMIMGNLLSEIRHFFLPGSRIAGRFEDFECPKFGLCVFSHPSLGWAGTTISADCSWSW